jgi:hypothetical protein
LLPKENLNPLTREYIIDRMNIRKVGKDCLVSYDGSQHSVPSEYAGREVCVVGMDSVVAFYHGSEQVAVHRKSAGSAVWW